MGALQIFGKFSMVRRIREPFLSVDEPDASTRHGRLDKRSQASFQILGSVEIRRQASGHTAQSVEKN